MTNITDERHDFTVVFFVDTKGEFRWNLVAKNGRKVATSGEGYTKREDCINIWMLQYRMVIDFDQTVGKFIAKTVGYEVPRSVHHVFGVTFDKAWDVR